ncbi:hypothetical protein LIER_39420 [Lithospermum erythrorhizon]|uniref:Uncharacterized protein n=1 Tax=Lithospermum erythrorhizon TaxID=34254 RepID=A0AAV3QFQ8_LITER
MSAELPVSTSILATTTLDMMGQTTNGSSWGNSNPASSLFEKLISSLPWAVTDEPKADTTLRAYFLLALEVSPQPAIPPEMVSTLPVTRGLLPKR